MIQIQGTVEDEDRVDEEDRADEEGRADEEDRALEEEEGIHSSFKPEQAHCHHRGEKPLIGPNLCQLWLQFQLERHEMDQ